MFDDGEGSCHRLVAQFTRAVGEQALVAIFADTIVLPPSLAYGCLVSRLMEVTTFASHGRNRHCGDSRHCGDGRV